MTIFRYELKQLRGSILIWSIALGASIFVMLPVYMEMFTSVGVLKSSEFSGNAFFEMIGTNIEILTSSMGAYSFLTTFVLMAAAINGMKLGLGSITKEYRNWTADFLFTKPHSRSKIFLSKLLASVTVVLIISAVYFAASWAGMEAGTTEGYDFRIFALIALSVLFMQLIFLALGLFIGVLFPHIKAPIMVSVGAAFVTYVLGSFSRKMSIAAVGYLSPYVYFDNVQTIINNGYRAGYMILFVVLSAIFITAGHYFFCKKDVLPTA